MSNVLKELRLKANLTMQGLADLAGTTAPQINKLEKGQRTLDKQWALRLAPYLGVTAEEILFPRDVSYQQPGGGYGALHEAPVYGGLLNRNGTYSINKDNIINHKPSNLSIMGEKGFYITVTSDTMEPLFEEGQILAVNPDYPLVKGKPCLIETINNETLIRKFISRNEGELICTQLNPLITVTVPMALIIRVSRIVGQEF